MKRKILIEFNINPLEYYGVKDNVKGITELVQDMLHHMADFPDTKDIKISVKPIDKKQKK